MNCRCKLCGKIFPETEMSEEHYPAKSVGNDDVVAVDIVKMLDTMQSGAIMKKAADNIKRGISIKDTAGVILLTSGL